MPMPSEPRLLSPLPRFIVRAVVVTLLVASCVVGQAPPSRAQRGDTLCDIAGTVMSEGTGQPIMVKAVCGSSSWADAQKNKSNWVPFTARQTVRIYQVSSEGQKLILETRELTARNGDGSLYIRENPVASAFWSRGTLLDARTRKAYRLDYEHRCAVLLDRASFVRPPLRPPTGEEHGHASSENSLGTRMIGGIQCVGFKYRVRLLTRLDGSQISLLDGTVGEETWEIWVAPSLNYQVLEETRPVLPYVEDIKPFVPSVGKTAQEVRERTIIEKRILGTIQAGREPDPEQFHIPAGFRILAAGPWDAPPRQPFSDLTLPSR